MTAGGCGTVESSRLGNISGLPSRLGDDESAAASRGLVQNRVQGPPGLTQLNAQHDLRDSEDQAVQAEQQREGDRADVGTSGEHDAEREGYQPGDEEQRPGARSLCAA